MHTIDNERTQTFVNTFHNDVFPVTSGCSNIEI